MHGRLLPSAAIAHPPMISGCVARNSLGFGDDTPLKRATEMPDFFSTECVLVTCCFTFKNINLRSPEIISAFLQHQNRAIIFSALRTQGRVRQSYRRRFPDDQTMTDLSRWHIFETENPAIFVGMYQFWIQKTC